MHSRTPRLTSEKVQSVGDPPRPYPPSKESQPSRMGTKWTSLTSPCLWLMPIRFVPEISSVLVTIFRLAELLKIPER